MKLYKFVACLIPIKKYRKAYREYVKNYINLHKIKNNYQKQINKLRSLSKINVYFLVWENCKWSYEDVYINFSKNKHFNTQVLLLNNKHPVCNLEQNKEFFTQKGIHYSVIRKLSELKKLNPHIIFYEQPWFALNNDSFSPKNLSKLCLCFYAPYGIELDLHKKIMLKLKSFYLGCYKHFVFNTDVKTEMEKYGIDNSVVMGHPRLDAFLSPIKNKKIWTSKSKLHIIYAPHHSFAHSILKWATYEWSGQHLLELAQKHNAETEWIFKPHPKFYFALMEEFGKDYADKVFSDWGKVAKLYNTGDYFNLFRTADIMISDCDSFKIEWLPTGKPYINLISCYPDAEQQGPIRQYFSSGYYHAKNLSELDYYFDLLVNKHCDPLKLKRKQLIKQVQLHASENIYKFIKNLLRKDR